MLGRISSFETMGTLDGPGIRFVIFMQGCPLRCKFCHNPETWEINNGKDYSVQDCLTRILKYKNYISNGGVTISGGEPLMQIDFLIDLFAKLKENNISTCVDTSGYVFDKNNIELLKKFDELIKVTDLILLDIKHINNNEHKKLTGVSNQNVLDFAKYLSEHNIPVWIRYVLVPNVNSSEKDLIETRKFLNTLKNIQKVEVLPYHNLAISKYEKLGIDYPFKMVTIPTTNEIDLANKILANKGESI